MLNETILSDIELLEKKHRQKLKQFAFEPLTSSSPAETRHQHIVSELRLLGVWALQQTESALAAIESSSPYIVCFGFRPSRFHLGHLTLAREVAWHVTHGASACAVVSGAEAGKRCSDQGAQEKVAEFWKFALSFAPNMISEPRVFGDGSSGALQEACDAVAYASSVHKILQLYGWEVKESVWNFQAAIVNAATYLLPHLLSPGLPWINLTDINQLPHTELARLSAKRLRWPLPAYFLRKLLPSLRGTQERMSGKDAKSVIFLDESEDIVRQKLEKSASGGRITPEDQRKLGGDPLACSFFRAAETLLSTEERAQMLTACESGSVLCGDCKKQMIPKLLQVQQKLRRTL